MGQYDRQIKSVKKLIAKYGQIVTHGSNTGNIDIMMVFLSPSASGESKIGSQILQYLAGTQVSSGELRGFVAPFGIEPSLTDIIVRDGKELVISSIDTLAPNGQPILHVFEFVR